VRQAGALLLCLLCLCACAAQPPAAKTEAAKSATLFLIDRGWHTDVAFDTAQLHRPLAGLVRDLPGARYLVFGFGERHYVLAKDKNFGEMLAAVWPSPGLILATGLSATPEQAFGAGHVARIPVSPEQLQNAADFVWRSFAVDTDAALRPYAPGPYGGSLFYASSVTYYGLRTCNTWTAEDLQAAQLPVQSFGVIFANQVWGQVSDLAPP
jgi:uncharacterized protein (TIGR02117 family)